MPLENKDFRTFSSPSLYVELLLLLGLLLRIVAANGELWLDEVWNLKAVHNLKHASDVYLAPKGMDGHSSLFSLILFFLPDDLPDLSYRLPSVLFSTMTLWVIYFNSESPKFARLLRLLFFSTSYIFILYGIEARGYSGMILCLALAHTSFLRLAMQPARVRNTFLFILSNCFGFLFHYSFVIWFMGTGLAFAVAATVNRRLRSFQHFLALSIPAGFILLVYLVIVRHLPPGSGPHPSYFHTFLNIMSVTIGGIPLSNGWPPSVLIVLLFSFLFLWITSKEVTELYKEEPLVALYYLSTILIAPVLCTLIIQPGIAMPRYYLTSAFAFTALFSSYVYRTKARISPAIFLCGNLLLVMHLIWRHHGSYEAVISRVVTSAPAYEEPVLVVVDHEFRHAMMFEYYGNNQIQTVEWDDLKKINLISPPEWYLEHELDWAAIPAREITLETETYILDTVIPSTPLSGWTLFLYRRKD